MLADDVFDRTETGGRQAAGYGAGGARRNGRCALLGYDKTPARCPSSSTPQSRFCRKVTG